MRILRICSEPNFGLLSMVIISFVKNILGYILLDRTTRHFSNIFSFTVYHFLRILGMFFIHFHMKINNKNKIPRQQANKHTFFC